MVMRPKEVEFAASLCGTLTKVNCQPSKKSVCVDKVGALPPRKRQSARKDPRGFLLPQKFRCVKD